MPNNKFQYWQVDAALVQRPGGKSKFLGGDFGTRGVWRSNLCSSKWHPFLVLGCFFGLDSKDPSWKQDVSAGHPFSSPFLGDASNIFKKIILNSLLMNLSGKSDHQNHKGRPGDSPSWKMAGALGTQRFIACGGILVGISWTQQSTTNNHHFLGLFKVLFYFPLDKTI